MLNKKQMERAIAYNKRQMEKGRLTDEHIATAIAFFQSEYPLTVDGMAGPFTIAGLEKQRSGGWTPSDDEDPREDEDTEPEPEPGSDAWILARFPKGKGMFVRSLRHTGTPAQMIAQMNKANLDWVCIQYVWQFEDPDNSDKDTRYVNRSNLKQYTDALHAAGKTVWVWGWPVPGEEQKFLDGMLWAVDTAKAKGLMINAERPYLGNPAAATKLMQMIQPECRKRGILAGLSSYGAAHFVRRFPWREFAEYSDFGSPQMYDPDNNLGPAWPQDCWEAWKKVGFKHLIASSGCFNKTPKQMNDLLAVTPIEHDVLLWWDWVNANPERSDLWGPVIAFEIP
jgi:hypothetical protein